MNTLDKVSHAAERKAKDLLRKAMMLRELLYRIPTINGLTILIV